jgi:hypothetical protein
VKKERKKKNKGGQGHQELVALPTQTGVVGLVPQPKEINVDLSNQHA